MLVQTRSMRSGSSPVSPTTSSSDRCERVGGKRSSTYPYASRPSALALRICSSEWPRSRSRAAIRACAMAAGVSPPSPSGPGMTPVSAQRFSVARETPTRSAACLRLTVSSATR